MANVTREQIIKNLNLKVGFYGEDGVEKIVSAVQDDAVVFAGQGKSQNLVHVISGDSKAASHPNAVCGVWVSNKKRAPLSTEKVCSRCTRGGTSFTRTNQPRPCLSCGKLFADNATRDNTEQTCGTCYEEAGWINAHDDGHHKADADGFQEECPMCQEEKAGATDVAPQEDVTDSEPTVEQRFARRQVEHAEQRVKDLVAMIASRLRRAADDVERQGARITESNRLDSVMTEIDDANSVVNTISWLFPNLSAHELVAMAAALQDARRVAKEA